LRFEKVNFSLKVVLVCKQNCMGHSNAKWFCFLRNGDVKLFTLHDSDLSSQEGSHQLIHD